MRPQSTANKNEINYGETFWAVSPAGYVVINTTRPGHATGHPLSIACFTAAHSILHTHSERVEYMPRVEYLPQTQFRQKKVHLRLPSPLSAPCEWTVVAASGLVWSGPEPGSVPIVVFINLNSAVANAMFPVPEAGSRSSRDRSSRGSSCGGMTSFHFVDFCG